jgi:hypothetical protein
LAGAILVDGCWTLGEWRLRFSNDLSLRIWIPGTEVRWSLAEQLPELPEPKINRVGAPPIRLWFPHSTSVSECAMDCSALLAKRRGAEFQNLFVNDMALYVYFRSQLVLQFMANYRLDDGSNLLYVSEDD